MFEITTQFAWSTPFACHHQSAPPSITGSVRLVSGVSFRFTSRERGALLLVWRGHQMVAQPNGEIDSHPIADNMRPPLCFSFIRFCFPLLTIFFSFLCKLWSPDCPFLRPLCHGFSIDYSLTLFNNLMTWWWWRQRLQLFFWCVWSTIFCLLTNWLTSDIFWLSSTTSSS